MTNLITSEDAALKQKVIAYIWPVAASFFVAYILLSFFISKDYLTGWILLINFLVFSVVMIAYFKTKNVGLASNALAAIGIPVLLPWLINGGPAGVGFWWSIVYVIWAFIVTIKKTAIFWLLTHLVLSAIIVLLSFKGYVSVAYPMPILLNLLYAYIIATLYVYFLVSVLDYYLRLSQKRALELGKLNKDLEKANIISEQSKVSKELFLASMSHEIRTPLNSIIGFQQLLKDTQLTDEQKEYVESIDFAGRNLLVIINDILDLSKLEVGKFEFEEVEFNVGDITKSVVELVSQRAKEKNIELAISTDPKIPKVLYGDSARLSQILLNLVGNAIKFTEKGNVKITITPLKEDEDQIICRFSVEDTGIGIPEERLTSIFESFTQASSTTAREYGGTGLGLTISKHLVEMQGGTIQVESKEGKGSVFSFEIPYKKRRVLSQSSINKAADINQSHQNDSKLKILLVEDVHMNQRLVIKIMEKWGHDLDIADNGKIAVEKVTKNDYDLILMDIQMPEMDGYQATQLIRSMPDRSKQKVPIIALTAHASHAEAEKCINLGMNAYLAKPFNQQQLQNVINQLTLKA